MKSGVVLVFTLLCELAIAQVYYDQSGYGYGVNPKPSGLVEVEDKKLNPINGKSVIGTTEPIAPQESKPEAYLVRLKPKEAQDSSSIPNKKSKFLLLLRLPEDHEETQATSLNSEVQQRDEQIYSQPIGQSQDDYSSAGPSQQSSFSYENQKDEAGQQYQQQQQQQQLNIGQQQQQVQPEEAEVGQQNDSGYQQPLQADGYGQAQNSEQFQQKDDVYQQQAQPLLPPQQQQQQQQQDLPEELDQQAKDEGYQPQQPQQQQQQQELGNGPLTIPGPSQFQASAFKNGFSPLFNYERPQGLPVESVKGSRNNFFRSPVLQDSPRPSTDSNSNSQVREEVSYGGQRDAVKGQAVQPQSAYAPNVDSGRKSANSFVPSGDSRDATKGSFQSSSPSFYPSNDQARKSVPQTSSYPSQRSPMKSPSQAYAQQQQQQIEQSRKSNPSPTRDYYGQSAQPETSSFGGQQGFTSGFGSNEESTKSGPKESANYEAQQEGVKTQSRPSATPSAPIKQSSGKTSPNSDEYSNGYNSPASLARAPISPSFSAPVSGYETEQSEQQQPQEPQSNQQEEYNQSEQNDDDTQEKDEQSNLSADQQQNVDPEKKVPVILISLPPESNSYQQNDNQQRDEQVEPQQQQQQQQTDSDYQQSTGQSATNYESNFNGQVKGQQSQPSYEQNSQLPQTGSKDQQSGSLSGLKSPVQRFSTKSASPVKPQQLPVETSSGYPTGGAIKGGRPQQLSPSSVKGNQQQSTYDNGYPSNFQSPVKNTKSVQSPSSYSTKGFQQSPIKGERNQPQQQQQSTDDEQKQSQSPVKGSSQSTQENVKSSYSAALQAPVKAARAFQQSPGFSSEFQSTKGASDSYSNQQQQSVDSGYNNFQSSPVQQQSQPEQQQPQTQADLGFNNLQSTKGGRGQSNYQSVSQDSDNSDYQSPSSVKGSGPPTQQQQQQPTAFGYSSAFVAPTVQQTSSGYESNSYQSSSDGVKGGQRSPVQPPKQQQQQQQQQVDSYPSSQPAFASFSASVKGSAPPQQQMQSSDDGFSSGFQAANVPVAPVQQVQSDRGYNSGVKSAPPSPSSSSSGVKGGQQSSGFSGQQVDEQSTLSNPLPTKSTQVRDPNVALVIPTYRTKSGRSQLAQSTKSSNRKAPNSEYSTFSAPTQQQHQQEVKGQVRPQLNTKSLLSNPSTSYLPALSPPGSSKSPSPSFHSFPMKSQQQQQQSPKSLPLTQGLPPSPASIARSRPSQGFNFPSSPAQNQQQSSPDSYPSYSASSNSPIFDDEEDQMAITPDAMGAYGLRTNSQYDSPSPSATSDIRAVEQPQGSGRVVLLLFDKSRMNAQRQQMAFNAPEPHGVYKS